MEALRDELQKAEDRQELCMKRMGGCTDALLAERIRTLEKSIEIMEA